MRHLIILVGVLLILCGCSDDDPTVPSPYLYAFIPNVDKSSTVDDLLAIWPEPDSIGGIGGSYYGAAVAYNDIELLCDTPRQIVFRFIGDSEDGPFHLYHAALVSSPDPGEPRERPITYVNGVCIGMRRQDIEEVIGESESCESGICRYYVDTIYGDHILLRIMYNVDGIARSLTFTFDEENDPSL